MFIFSNSKTSKGLNTDLLTLCVSLNEIQLKKGHLRIFKDVFIMFAPSTGAFVRNISRIDMNCVPFAVFEPLPRPGVIQMTCYACKNIQ